MSLTKTIHIFLVGVIGAHEDKVALVVTLEFDVLTGVLPCVALSFSMNNVLSTFGLTGTIGGTLWSFVVIGVDGDVDSCGDEATDVRDDEESLIAVDDWIGFLGGGGGGTEPDLDRVGVITVKDGTPFVFMISGLVTCVLILAGSLGGGDASALWVFGGCTLKEFWILTGVSPDINIFFVSSKL
jgi:hypothetical protein